MGPPEQPADSELLAIDTTTAPLRGSNLGGTNLAGMNLGGMNLGGMNLGGMNLGGTNLGGMNLGGMNLGGTNLGGNNLGGMNLGGTNLGGMNLGGMNLGGMNLGGMNLAASNLGGSSIPGTNPSGMNLGGTNPAALNLAGAATGSNLHSLGSVNGMLYSGEDMWSPKTGQCIVLGIGSTAFARLLGQQSPSARCRSRWASCPGASPTPPVGRSPSRPGRRSSGATRAIASSSSVRRPARTGRGWLGSSNRSSAGTRRPPSPWTSAPSRPAPLSIPRSAPRSPPIQA